MSKILRIFAYSFLINFFFQMKKYILKSVTDNEDCCFVVLLKNVYYFTHSVVDATRFDTIGDAMRKSVEIYNSHKRRFQVFPVFE